VSPRDSFEVPNQAERNFLNLVALHMPPGFSADLEPRSPQQWRDLAERFKVLGNSEATFLSDCDPEVLAEETARRGHQLCAIALDFGILLGALINAHDAGESYTATFKLEVLP
jgi:hypothetical protein